jgi:phosphoserine phosphatase
MLISHVRLTDENPPDQYDFVTKYYCYVIKQPGVDRLLQVATDHDYELVVFTAGSRDYASPIIDQLDPLKLIAHQLYKDSCKDDSREKLFIRIWLRQELNYLIFLPDRNLASMHVIIYI